MKLHWTFSMFEMEPKRPQQGGTNTRLEVISEGYSPLWRHKGLIARDVCSSTHLWQSSPRKVTICVLPLNNLALLEPASTSLEEYFAQLQICLWYSFKVGKEFSTFNLTAGTVWTLLPVFISRQSSNIWRWHRGFQNNFSVYISCRFTGAQLNVFQ